MAYWIEKEHLFRDTEFQCSNCGWLFKHLHDTCPHCKAQMKKVRYDPEWVDEIEMFDMLN